VDKYEKGEETKKKINGKINKKKGQNEPNRVCEE
jgi:hypothetical protein